MSYTIFIQWDLTRHGVASKNFLYFVKPFFYYLRHESVKIINNGVRFSNCIWMYAPALSEGPNCRDEVLKLHLDVCSRIVGRSKL